MTDSSCDFGIDFHRKIDDFYSKKHSFLLVCRRRHRFDSKNHRFFDGNRSQNRMKNPSKIIKILIYVGNALSDAGECGERMGTFLGSYRLEKRSKSHGVSENSITIGIPIQMDILCRPSLQLHFGQPLTTSQTITPSELTSRQIKIESNRSNPSRPPLSSQSSPEMSFWGRKQSTLIAM